MLGLVAAQLKHKVENREIKPGKAVWVDVSCIQCRKRGQWLMKHCRLVVALGKRIEQNRHFRPSQLTRDSFNIEAMSAFVPVEKFFDHVYLVDLSPSLCDVARQRFQRLGWKNVTVICQDARSFRLPERQVGPKSTDATSDQVDLITMSYSLSMIPGRSSLKVR